MIIILGTQKIKNKTVCNVSKNGCTQNMKSCNETHLFITKCNL